MNLERPQPPAPPAPPVLPHRWLGHIIESKQVRALVGRLSQVDRIIASGSRGSSTNLIAGSVAIKAQRPVLLVVAHLDEADDALDDLELFPAADHKICVQRFGALEVLPGESAVSLELLAERLALVGQLAQGRTPNVIVSPIQALMQAVPRPEALNKLTFTISRGQEIAPGQLMNWLSNAGYQRQDTIEQPGDFAVRGGIVDIYPPAGRLGDQDYDTSTSDPAIGPIRLDYFADQIESISQIDLDTMGSAGNFGQVHILGASSNKIQSQEHNTHLLELLPDDCIVIMHELLELTEQARGYYERLTDPQGIYSPNSIFQKLTSGSHIQVNQYSSRGDDPAPIDLRLEQLISFDQDAASSIQQLGELAQDPVRQVVVLCRKPAERDRLNELLIEHIPATATAITIEVGNLHRGFIWQNDAGSSLHLVPHHEMFHRYEMRRRIRRISADTAKHATDAFVDMEVGDSVVHVEHGIARFTGIKTMRRGGHSQEYLTLEFAGNALLHVPATQIDLIQRYVGGFHGKPPLSKLGGKTWSKQKDSVAQAVRDLAKHLLQVQAARQTTPGTRYPEDTTWQKEFEAEFPFDETEDQLAAVAAIKQDMGQDKPMDRLICGDVGFGKTEVAIRAAFKAVEFAKQVAVLVPTTLLAEQHERTFHQRVADYPFSVASISRFKTPAQQNKLLEQLAAGQVDIIIGTHRLLSGDVRFADLGLVIVDEEQRFGVEHKNKLLEYRLTAEVLTLTATPIPRTLHMSMIGLRDISSLSIAPVDRRAIVTEVIPYDKHRIKMAINRELNRDGQVYFVHNRVYNIQAVADDIKKLVPEARIAVGHGQMPPRQLEEVMLRFIHHEVDILVSTTIIESGIDIPTANTMFINQADYFGLADLHQLRGRVGRYKHRAYCYMLLPEQRTVSETAAKRLKAIEQYSMLGAGFKIAMRDLEIRGAGNLLGPEQSGHIAAVGYEMYCLLLEQETKRLRHQPIIETSKTHLELPVAGLLPKRYISSNKFRLEAYRRLSRSATLDELDDVTKSLRDAYGKPPQQAQQLIDLTELRIAAAALGIDRIKLEGPDLIFTADRLARLDQTLAQAPGRISVIDQETIYYRPPGNYLSPPATLLAVLRKLFVTPLREKSYAPGN